MSLVVPSSSVWSLHLRERHPVTSAAFLFCGRLICWAGKALRRYQIETLRNCSGLIAIVPSSSSFRGEGFQHPCPLRTSGRSLDETWSNLRLQLGWILVSEALSRPSEICSAMPMSSARGASTRAIGEGMKKHAA